MVLTAQARERFEEVQARVRPLLAQAGYAAPRFVPVSAMRGVNLGGGGGGGGAATAGLSWYDGPTLLDALDTLEAPARPPGVGTRLCVNDAFRSTDAGAASLGAFTLSGTLQVGEMARGARLLLLPAAEQVTVKTLRSRGAPVERAAAGDHVEVWLAQSPAEPSVVGAGCVLCDASKPAPLARLVEVQLRVLPCGAALSRGMPCEAYCHAASVPAVLVSLVCRIDRQGRRVNGPRPRVLLPGGAAVVQLQLSRAVCVELYAACRPMGRVVLREGGITLAAGTITAVLA